MSVAWFTEGSAGQALPWETPMGSNPDYVTVVNTEPSSRTVPAVMVRKGG